METLTAAIWPPHPLERAEQLLMELPPCVQMAPTIACSTTQYIPATPVRQMRPAMVRETNLRDANHDHRPPPISKSGRR